MGQSQLRASKAVWKIIERHADRADRRRWKEFENCANGPGPALGRELEIAELLAYIRREKIHNTIWLTADVHYAASHFYDPAKAFTEFAPFWEFVSGPLHAASPAPAGWTRRLARRCVSHRVPKGPRHPAHTRTSSISARWRSMGRQRRRR